MKKKVITKLIIDCKPKERRVLKMIRSLGTIVVGEIARVGQKNKVAVTIWTDSMEERASIIRSLQAKLAPAKITVQTTQYFSG